MPESKSIIKKTQKSLIEYVHVNGSFIVLVVYMNFYGSIGPIAGTFGD